MANWISNKSREEYYVRRAQERISALITHKKSLQRELSPVTYCEDKKLVAKYNALFRHFENMIRNEAKIISNFQKTEMSRRVE